MQVNLGCRRGLLIDHCDIVHQLHRTLDSLLGEGCGWSGLGCEIWIILVTDVHLERADRNVAAYNFDIEDYLFLLIINS